MNPDSTKADEAAPPAIETLALEDGKYELRRRPEGALCAFRYGEPWRDLTGDKLVNALMDVALASLPTKAVSNEAALTAITDSEVKPSNRALGRRLLSIAGSIRVGECARGEAEAVDEAAFLLLGHGEP